MKKLTAMLLITAMICASLSACGQVDDPAAKGENDTDAETTSVESEVTTGETTDAVSEAAKNDEQPTEDEEKAVTEAPADESKPEETVTETTTSQPADEPDITLQEQYIDTIDMEYKFEEGYSFGELVHMGLANANGYGLGYVLIPSDGGAGHSYYKVYSTNDGGASWTECEFYDELNGRVQHIPLDDGGIMTFGVIGAYAERYPMVSILYFDGSRIMATPLADVLGDTVLNDGTLLKDAGEVSYEIAYLGGHSFDITYYDFDTDEMLGEVQYDLSDAVFNALQYPAE